MKIPPTAFLLALPITTLAETPAALQREEHRILIVLTNHEALGDTGRKTGFFLSEATHPYKVFTDAGYTVDFLSPKGGRAPIEGRDEVDAINAKYLADPAFILKTETTLSPAQVKAEDYKAIFFAGGHGTMWDFADDTNLERLTGTIHGQGGVVAAVCHGPAALVNVKLSNGEYLVAGQPVSAFSNAEEVAVKLDRVVPFALETKLRERGAKYEAAPNFEAKVLVGNRLVTGQNPASATGVAEGVVKVLRQAAPTM